MQHFSWRKKYNGFLPAAGACGLVAVSLVFSLLLDASFQSMVTEGSLEACICCLKKGNNITDTNWAANQIMMLCSAMQMRVLRAYKGIICITLIFSVMFPYQDIHKNF